MPRRRNRFPLLSSTLLLALSTFVLAACTTPDRTTELATLKPPICAHPYHCNTIGDDPNPGTLVIVSASGGGSRAAAFLLGTLQALDTIQTPGRTTMLDQVDLISSVSGGSVTAAAFALDRRDGLDRVDQWLRNTDMSDIVFRYINPKSSLGNWFPGRAQIDVLIDMLSEDELFGRRKFGLVEKQKRPYLVLNSADMGLGTVFSFTQPTFDLICADLSEFAVADAVAGSAAYPFGFGALTLRNHSYPSCPAHESGRDQIISGTDPPEARWPPMDLAVSTASNRYDYAQVEERRRKDQRRSYFYNPETECSFDGTVRDRPQCKAWLHLLDGGISDNLGVSSALEMLVDLNASPSFAQDIAAGRVTRIIFVVVNARGEKDYGLEASPDSPGWIPQIRSVTGSPIDATSGLLLASLESKLKSDLVSALSSRSGGFGAMVLLERLESSGDIPRDDTRPTEVKLKEIENRIKDIQVEMVPVDFDFIPTDCTLTNTGPCDPDDTTPRGERENSLRRLRRYMKAIATNWWLDDGDIDLTRDVAKCLVAISELKAVIDHEAGVPHNQRCFIPLAMRVPPDFE